MELNLTYERIKDLQARETALRITFIAFCLINLIPSDPAEVAIRVNDVTPTPELIEQTRVALGLD